MNVGEFFGYALLSVVCLRGIIIVYDLLTHFFPACYKSVSPDVIGLTEDIVLDMSLHATPEQNPKKSKKPVKQKTTKNTVFMQEVSMTLHGLGMKKSQANSVVSKLCKEKAYNSSEDLLKDAIVYIR